MKKRRNISKAKRRARRKAKKYARRVNRIVRGAIAARIGRRK